MFWDFWWNVKNFLENHPDILTILILRLLRKWSLNEKWNCKDDLRNTSGLNHDFYTSDPMTWNHLGLYSVLLIERNQKIWAFISHRISFCHCSESCSNNFISFMFLFAIEKKKEMKLETRAFEIIKWNEWNLNPDLKFYIA